MQHTYGECVKEFWGENIQWETNWLPSLCSTQRKDGSSLSRSLRGSLTHFQSPDVERGQASPDSITEWTLKADMASQWQGAILR